MAKTRHSKPPNKGHRKTSLSTPEKYRVLIARPGHDHPTHYSTSDLAQAKAIARRNAATGAHVTLQRHENWGRYTTIRTYILEPR